MADIDSSEIFGSAPPDDVFAGAKSFQSAPQTPQHQTSPNNVASSEQSPENSDFVKFLYDFFPFLRPNQDDLMATKIKKQQQIARFQSLSQEARQIALQKFQNWEQRKAVLAQEENAQKAAQEQAVQSPSFAPPGRRQGAQAATSTDELLDQMRNKSSDLTQAVG